MATKEITLKTASVLAFERKLDPSDALFFAGDWGQRDSTTGWTPITVREKSVRGTISNRLKTKDQDPAKLDAAIENPNLQTVDVAALPADADTLKASFTLRVLGGTGTPSACNNADYQAKLLSTVKGYAEASGFGELSRRYAYNLANGRFLWRNRVGAEQVEVRVEHLVQGQATATWVFDGLRLSLRNFDAPEVAAKDLQALANLITQGLAGQSHVLLRVTAYARVGAAQEVYPSQELILDKGNSKKSKTCTTYKAQPAFIHKSWATRCAPSIRGTRTWTSLAPSRWSPTVRSPHWARLAENPRTSWTSTTCWTAGC
jgi:CRISPR-associated protein Csy3